MGIGAFFGLQILAIVLNILRQLVSPRLSQSATGRVFVILVVLWHIFFLFSFLFSAVPHQQNVVQPSYTSTHLNHHLSFFYKLPTCRFPCAFCQPSIFLAHFLSNQDGTIHPLFLPISSLFYRRNHQGIHIPQDLPPKSITCHLFHFQPCPLHQDLPIPPRASLPLYTLPNNSPGRLLSS